jgi:hypothetical protein
LGAPVSVAPFDQTNVHSVRRLYDKVSGVFPRIYGAGTKIYLAEGTVAIDTGYSGNPLSMIPFRPEKSPLPWLYIGDSARMRKVRSDGRVHTVGIEPPLAAPTVGFGPPAFQIISDFEALSTWANGGTAGALSVVPRINTTIAKILYDVGTTGWASIQPTAFTDQMQRGMFVIINAAGGSAETVLVDDVYQAMTATTIGSIAYDAGANGLCTIQPVLATSSKSNFPYQPGLGDAGGRGPIIGRGPLGRVPRNNVILTTDGMRIARPQPPIRSSSSKPVGVQINSLIRLNSGGGNDEVVRVLGVSMGKDGQVSFRCSTVGTHIAGETITGVPSFRAYLLNTHALAETLTNNSFQTTVAAGTGTVSIVTPFNIAAVAGRSVQEDDEIHISLRFDHPEFLSEARLIFDVDTSINDFAHNYLYHALRQSDMQLAVTSGQTNLAARQAALTRAITSSYSRNLGVRQIGPVSLDNPGALGAGPDLTGVDSGFTRGGQIGTSAQATTGASQWTEFRFKVSDLVRVGGDLSKNLSNVAGIRIQLAVTGSTVVNIDALWVGGTYGPDIGTIGAPLFYRVRGRSKITGAKSLAGPPTRSGIEPHRQRVIVNPQQHPNTSVDTLDVFRFGGTLNAWTYVGSCPNVALPQFFDDYDDTSLQTNPLLDLDVFQPFPTIDLPRSGVLNTIGSKLIWVSGDQFNTAWYPGSQISINGVYYSLYAQPADATHMEIVENAGTQNAVPFFLNNPTLLGQPLPAWWGPYAEGTAAFFFACGDIYQPGVLFLTNGNDPDSASDTLQIEVTSPSEPLVNGCMYDSTPYVFTSEGLFRLYPNIGQGSTLFIPKRVANTKGLFAKWALAVGRFMYALGKDGIYKTDGALYESITNADLYMLFPHDGQPGQPIKIGSVTVNPPDMTQPAKLRLSCYDEHLYFDFVDTSAVQRTLVYNEIMNVWGIDDTTPTILTHYGDEGEGVHGLVCGGTDGRVYVMNGTQDNGADFPCEMRFPTMSELPTPYQLAPDAIIGLISSGSVNLIINVDGVDVQVVIPSTASKYVRVYQRMPPIKGKLLAFALTAAKGFSLNRRDSQVRMGGWGRAQTSEALSSGSMGPINPFADLRRPYGPKVS